MFTTPEQVQELTSYTVSIETVIMAQAIIESWVGRIEEDVAEQRDFALLARATAYQAAYMLENAETVFQQVSLSSIGQFGQMITFRAGDKASPFIAPLADIACTHLSWKRIRSIKTGSMFPNVPGYVPSWRTN